MGADRTWAGGEELDGVLEDGALDGVASTLPPEAMESGRALLRYLSRSTDEWERVGRWRMEARTEAYRRALANGGL